MGADQASQLRDNDDDVNTEGGKHVKTGSACEEAARTSYEIRNRNRISNDWKMIVPHCHDVIAHVIHHRALIQPGSASTSNPIIDPGRTQGQESLS